MVDAEETKRFKARQMRFRLRLGLHKLKQLCFS